MGHKRYRTGGATERRLTAVTVLRTLEALCFLAGVGSLVLCLGFGRVIGPNWMTVAAFGGFIAMLAVRALERQVALAEAKRKREQAERDDDDPAVEAGLAALEQEIAAQNAETVRLKREQEARAAVLARVRLTGLSDADFPSRSLH